MDKVKIAIVVVVVLIVCLGVADGFFFHVWKKPNRGFTVEERDLTFQLYVRRNPERGSRLFVNDRRSLYLSGFNSSLPTRIITHGYMDSGTAPWILKIKSALLQVEDSNVIGVDWSRCAQNILYDRVVTCMKQCAYYLGELLKYLQREGHLNYKRTHMIGHSLGAHMVALAADAIPVRRAIGRITGLDPAGPLFENVHESERLNPGSARFVDVIHSSSLFVSVRKPIGTVDFYPNGGYFQPGCDNFDMSCHHKACQRYFLNTIKPSQRFRYPSRKCRSLQHALNGSCNGEVGFMGFYADRSSPGLYYIKLYSIS